MLITDAFKEIKDKSTFTSRRTIHSGKLSIVDAGLVEVADEERFTLGPRARQQLYTWLALPTPRNTKQSDTPSNRTKSLSQRLGPQLFGQVANRLWQKGIEDGSIPAQIRLLQHGGKQVVGFDSPALQTLNSGDVIDVIEQALPRDSFKSLEVRHLDCSPEGFTLRASTPQLATQVRVGDIVEGGFSIVHSALGATQVRTFLNRLVCSNGLLVPVCNGTTPTRLRRRSSSDRFNESLQLELLGKLVKQSFADLESKLAALAKLAGHPIDAAKAIEQLSIRHGLSRKVHDALLVALSEDEATPGEETEFSLVQAISRVATHGLPNSGPPLRDAIRQRLFVLAGILSQQRYHVCSHCNSIVAGAR